MNNNKIKKIAIVMLILAIGIMSSAYAVLYQRLSINGKASVVASWKVEIVGIKEGTIVGNASSLSIPTYTTTSASFDASLTDEKDSIQYIVTIKNAGTIDAKLNDIANNFTPDDAIIYEVDGVNENDVLLSGDTVDVTITVKIKPGSDITEGVNSDVTLVFDYVQNV